jgi:tRNA (guanine-N7-)-methyltransferase
VGKRKLKKFADLASFNHVIEAPFRSIDQEDHELKGKWNSFFGNNQPLVLELGCGKGEYTAQLAEKYPDKNFIGIDIKGARMWKGAKDTKEKGLKNVAFLRTNIEIIHTFFAKGEVNEIWLTFPDPQMKKTRRRLTATNFIEKYRQILVQNGLVHLKTDSNFQYVYTEAMVMENRFGIVCNTNDLYRSGLADDILSIRTFYEKQWLERGISIKYLSFRLNHDEPLHEPDVEIEKDAYRSFGRSARE